MVVLVVGLHGMTWLSVHTFFVWNKVARTKRDSSRVWENLNCRAIWEPCFHPSFSKVDTWNCFVNVDSGKSIVKRSYRKRKDTTIIEFSCSSSERREIKRGKGKSQFLFKDENENWEQVNTWKNYTQNILEPI